MSHSTNLESRIKKVVYLEAYLESSLQSDLSSLSQLRVVTELCFFVEIACLRSRVLALNENFLVQPLVRTLLLHTLATLASGLFFELSRRLEGLGNGSCCLTILHA